MSPDERKREIVLGAIRYFAEGGFGSQTRELAQRLGVSNALLFKYFPTKDALIEAIYEELFLRRWKPEWESTIADEERDLVQRLEAFYLDYAKMLHDREWVRIYLYSGLAGAPLARRFGEMVNQRIFVRVIDAVRHEHHFVATRDYAPSEDEIELIWSLHGGIFYIGVRKWIYGSEVPSDVSGIVGRLVREYLAAAKTLLDEGVVPKASGVHRVRKKVDC
ncbi:hypothetical protein R69746_07850 [Paraburkholderia aspalathi]|nr:hypothetical protein R69746_07850 [Paraburkholderia aspalathi]CAE6869284.1 hypothetical protein R75465_08173 [Paraburkholderia aspalathi]